MNIFSLKRIALLMLLCAPSLGFALTAGPTLVKEVGCDTSNICFVTIATATGPSACSSVSIRWDGSTSAGKNELSLLMTAYTAQRPVFFYILNTCFPLDTQYPTFGYILLQ